ncbi:MAG: hypothetical protein C4547_15110 [Phycisphaerales bacterium]|nr:MAG: hypothetical protein C4547_15110 [Phycisphaerales bacterium]
MSSSREVEHAFGSQGVLAGTAVKYVGQGVLRLEAKIWSRYTHILIMYDNEKSELRRETVTFLTDRVVIEVSNLSCSDAPHYVGLLCPTHRSCYATKKALGECS